VITRLSQVRDRNESVERSVLTVEGANFQSIREARITLCGGNRACEVEESSSNKL
jgi:hypothetical protein